MRDDQLIFDVGCNNGQDAEFYLRKGFRVIGVEANPALCSDLKNRFSAQIDDGTFVLIDKAIAEHDGEVQFFVNEKADIWGTIRADQADRNAAMGAPSTKIVVPSITFASLIERFGVPYYLKIDIEGADLLCLEGLVKFRERPKFVSFENEQSNLLECFEGLNLLKKLGYARFQIVDQSLIPEQSPPNPSREGVYSNYRFDLGATGLFGRELPGKWLAYGATAATYTTIFIWNKLYGLSKRIPGVRRIVPQVRGSWYDTHAAL
jgi:FkbM family methyltransferase